LAVGLVFKWKSSNDLVRQARQGLVGDL